MKKAPTLLTEDNFISAITKLNEKLDKLSTKEEVGNLRIELIAFKSDMGEFKESVNMKLDKLATKQDVYDMTANIMNSADEIDAQVRDHEKRITSLESAKN